ncbi:hexokinase-like isoform X2 [Littorina saxatilis]
MSRVTAMRVCIQLLAAAGIVRNTNGATITCEAGTFVVAQPATVTCNFRLNVSASQRSVNMARYPSDAEKGEIGTDVLVCHWSEEKQKHDCIVSDGYMFDGVITDYVKVEIPNTTHEFAGLYMCFFVPSAGRDSHACELFTVTKESELRTPPTDEETNHTLLVIVLPVTAIIVFMLWCALIFCICKRRKTRTRKRVFIETDLQIPLIYTRDKQIKTRLEGFELSKKDLKDLMNIMNREMNKGLNDSTRAEADVKMLPVYYPLQDKPVNAGVLILDFKRTQLKLLEMKLREKDGTVTSKNYDIPPELNNGSGQTMLDFIADAVKRFVRDKKISTKALTAVLIFPYPREGVVDPDVHELIQKVLQSQEKKLKMMVIANDVVNTVVSVGYQNPNCKIGLVVGNAFNACYVVKWRKYKTDSNKDEQTDEMQVVYNTELGALGHKCSIDFLRTDFDKEVAASSRLPDSQILEKMVSWAYIGEIVRVALKRMRTDKLLLRSAPEGCPLFLKDGLNADCVAEIDRDASEDHTETNRILTGLGVSECTQEDLQIVQNLCRLVIQRAAFLAAAVLATLINRLNQHDVVVVVDGELYRNIPYFYNLMHGKTQELVKSRLKGKFYFVSAFAGGYIGAARMAAAAARSQGEQTPMYLDCL